MKLEFEIIDTKGIKISLKENSEEVGRCFIYLIKNELHEKPYALLEDVFVKEDYRGKGFGSFLVKEAIKKAKELGCYKIIATSRFERTYVHKFYKSLGFKNWGYEFRLNM
jgi:GNAT superfamily N-acetyltransferase